MTDTPITNPMGLSLTNVIQAALAEYVTNMVNAAVAQAMADAKTGGLAAVMLDATLNERIRDVVDDMDLATKDHVTNRIDDKLSEHTDNYDHDEFLTDDNLKEKVEEMLGDCSVSISLN